MRGTLRAADRWLFGAERPERLAALRIGLCALVLFRLLTVNYVRLSGQPAALFRPVSFMRLLPALPPPGIVLAVQSVGGIAALLALLGGRARVTLPLAWTAYLFLSGMTTSLGKIMHNDVLLLLCLVPFLAAPTSDAWSLDALRRRGRGEGPPSPRYGWPVRTGLVIVVGAYFFAGLAKLVNSGPAWVTSGNLRWALYASSDAQAAPNPWALFVADRPWLAHTFAAGTLLLELGFPAALAFPRLRWLFVLGVVGLHAGIGLAMGLNYAVQATTVVVVMTDGPDLWERAQALWEHGRRRRGNANAAGSVT